MVATDVAARGLDIPDVEYVINYSFPLTIGDNDDGGVRGQPNTPAYTGVIGLLTQMSAHSKAALDSSLASQPISAPNCRPHCSWYCS